MKKFLLMMLAVFAYTSANAAKFVKVDDNNYTLVIDGSADAISFEALNDITDRDGLGTSDADYAKVTRLELKGDLSDGFGAHWWNSDATEPTNISVIDMSGADFCSNGTKMGTGDGEYAKWSLKGFNHLQEVIWPAAGKIVVIPEEAFKESGRPYDEGGWTVEIPGYIKLIKTNAFNESSSYRSLKSVVFKEYPETGTSQVNMTIEVQAFQNCYNLYDVYIETMGTLNAAYNAFPFWVSNSHTDGTRRLGTLHFPEEKVADYVNLQHELTANDVASDGAFQAWLSAHATAAASPTNQENGRAGWYEYVNAAPITNYDPEPYDKFIKTFSHPTISFIMGEGVKAYIVNAIEPSGENFVVTLKRVNVIPAGTGVILYGEANATTSDGEGKTYSLTAVKYTGPGPYIRGGQYSEEWTNYLMPTSPEAAEGDPEPGVDVEPYDTENGVLYRNFGLGYFSVTRDGIKYGNEHQSGGVKQYGVSPVAGADASKGERTNGDFVGFFRMMRGSHIAPRKAYLRLSETEYTDPNGGEVIVGDGEKQTHPTEATIKNYQLEYKKGQTTATPLTWTQLVQMNLWQNANWEKDWGVRDFGSGNNASRMVTFDGEPATDGIIQLVIGPAVEENGAIYNLQGVEVTNPTKGVYIKNGKKFVVK